MKTALWVIAFAQVYNIVEAWVWSLHWRFKGKRDFQRKIDLKDDSTELKRLLATYRSMKEIKDGE